ncbi:MAG: hypothetical protein ACLP53_28575 [Isosphaeraceae bacterium]
MAKGDFGYDERIPEEIREVFAKLCDDVAFLQHAWNFYLSLFSKAENTQLMWDFAPASFQMIGSSGDKCECRGKRPSPSKKAHKSRDARTKKRKSQMIEEALRSYLTMAISRLSDPARLFGYDNLSFATLAQKCQKIAGAPALEQDVKEFTDTCKPVHRIRNKLVGHNDLNARISPSQNPIPGVGRPDIDQILDWATKILNKLFNHFVPDGELRFHPHHVGGADALIDCLKAAREVRKKKMQEYGLETGTQLVIDSSCVPVSAIAASPFQL